MSFKLSIAGVRKPSGVHKEISWGTWMAVKFLCVAIVNHPILEKNVC